jgi:nucleoside-diphosphate-sugar epimerase
MDAQAVVKTDLDFICGNLQEELSQMAGKNVLMTGGAGFLGYYMVQALLRWNQGVAKNERIHVTVMDNFIRGVPQWMAGHTGENCELLKHDVTHPLPDGMRNFSHIIHAASIASPIYYRQFPIETLDANVQGLRILLDYSKRQKETEHPIEGFLFFSSSEVYGNPAPEFIPTPETYYGYVSFTGPRACYDESKRFGETLCVNFARQYELPISMARPFNNYGPGLKITDKRVVPDFANDILQGRDIVMFSDGAPSRTFCYVADAVVGYFKTLTKGRPGEAYNIGTEAPEITIFDIASQMTTLAKSLFQYSGRVVRRQSQDPDYLVDNPNRRCPNIDKARKYLGYDPAISLEEGLKRTLLWYAGTAGTKEIQ